MVGENTSRERITLRQLRRLESLVWSDCGFRLAVTVLLALWTISFSTVAKFSSFGLLIHSRAPCLSAVITALGTNDNLVLQTLSLSQLFIHVSLFFKPLIFNCFFCLSLENRAQSLIKKFSTILFHYMIRKRSIWLIKRICECIIVTLLYVFLIFTEIQFFCLINSASLWKRDKRGFANKLELVLVCRVNASVT